MTSIEWLFDELWNMDKDKFAWHHKLEQAKKMHYKEMMDKMQRGMELQEAASSKPTFRERNGLVELPKQETLYTEEQVREVAKYTISEWASYNEQREHDHEKLVKTWLSIEFKNFIQSL